jgi:tRNA uridine 5-carboxymethylaminomethyl modification enzyme
MQGLRRLAAEAHYENYIKREEAAAAKLRDLESWRVPESFDFAAIKGLKAESLQKLLKVKPTSLAQAGRIDGVTPAELALLQVHLARALRAGKERKADV